MVDMIRVLNRKFGPFSLRVWGLILNFIGNAFMLYGAVGLVKYGSRLALFITGTAVTVFCVAVLALPDKEPK